MSPGSEWRTRLPLAFRTSRARGKALGLREWDGGTTIRVAMGTVTSGIADEMPPAFPHMKRESDRDLTKVEIVSMLEGLVEGRLSREWASAWARGWIDFDGFGT